MKKILSCNKSIASAMLLRDALEERVGLHYLVSQEADKIGRDGCLIRYGNGFPIGDGYPDTEFNPPDFIELCKDKMNFSKKMEELGILSPVFHYNGEPTPEQFPVLVRTTLIGSGGEGIKPCLNRDEFKEKFNAGDCWTPYYSVAYEIRAYIVGDQISHVYYKVPFAHQVNDVIKIRSQYHFSWTDSENKFGKLRRILTKILEASKGKFFSLDAGWLPNLGEYIVFEANSGSWMNNTICRSLADFLAVNIKPE